jgi:periplasmic divalent cation tolerance protein
MSALCVVFTTVPDAGCARRIAGALLDARVVACVNIVPAVESHYVWQGRREVSAELLLIVKTTAAQEEAVRGIVAREHPYECPELIAVGAEAWNPAYAAWIRAGIAGDVHPPE